MIEIEHCLTEDLLVNKIAESNLETGGEFSKELERDFSTDTFLEDLQRVIVNFLQKTLLNRPLTYRLPSPAFHEDVVNYVIPAEQLVKLSQPVVLDSCEVSTKMNRWLHWAEQHLGLDFSSYNSRLTVANTPFSFSLKANSFLFDQLDATVSFVYDYDDEMHLVPKTVLELMLNDQDLTFELSTDAKNKLLVICDDINYHTMTIPEMPNCEQGSLAESKAIDDLRTQENTLVNAEVTNLNKLLGLDDSDNHALAIEDGKQLAPSLEGTLVVSMNLSDAPLPEKHYVPDMPKSTLAQTWDDLTALYGEKTLEGLPAKVADADKE